MKRQKAPMVVRRRGSAAVRVIGHVIGWGPTFLPVSLNLVCSRYAAAAKLEEKISSACDSI